MLLVHDLSLTCSNVVYKGAYEMVTVRILLLTLAMSHSIERLTFIPDLWLKLSPILN